MCGVCGREVHSIDYVISNGSERVINLCPNCSVSLIYEDKFLDLLNSVFSESGYVSEISGEKNAICIEDSRYRYVVTPEEAERLLGYDLSCEEFKKLTETHSVNEYLLHDDFYIDGVAQQPVKDR